MTDRPHVVILGAGFGGLGTLQKLRGTDVDITMIDKNDYHTFQPLLYQVATDELAPTEVAYPIRELMHRHKNLVFHRAVAQRVDPAKREVVVDGMPPLSYDYLVLALGAIVNFHETPGAAEHSFPLYTMNDAIRLHDHILNQFERVDKNPKLADDGALTFCIVGGGPTGTELAGALAELVHAELTDDYSTLPLEKVRIILYESSPDLLVQFQPKLRDYAQQALQQRGVEIQTGVGVRAVQPTEIVLENGDIVKTQTLVWAAGLTANPIAKSLSIPLEAGGRIPVQPDLQLREHLGVFAVGDIAAMTDVQTGKPLPGLGAVALQAGRHVGDTIRQLIAGKTTVPFQYVDKGTMAQVGRGAAIAQLPMGATLTGHVAWLAWLGVHLSLLSGGEERTSVFVDWGWNLLTQKRGKRIIFSDEDLIADN